MTARELVLIRKQLGLSQEALAESLGYSRNSVARWETNRRPIRALVALRMTQLLTEHLTRRCTMTATNPLTTCETCDTLISSWSWTDTHGIAQCLTCGTPYRLLHYDAARTRLDLPPCSVVRVPYQPLLRAYWTQFHRRIPSGHSVPGGHECASHDEAEQFYAWLTQQKEPQP